MCRNRLCGPYRGAFVRKALPSEPIRTAPAAASYPSGVGVTGGSGKAGSGVGVGDTTFRLRSRNSS